MLSKNMHYVYNREYFDIVFENEKKNEKNNEKKAADPKYELYAFQYTEEVCQYPQVLKDNLRGVEGLKEFSLYTTYPGFVVGSGYPHDSGVKDSIVGGFFFDQVTGLPILPGSSLKGTLRLYFEDTDEKRLAQKKLLIKSFLQMEIDGNDYKEFFKNLFMEADIYLGAYPIVKAGQKIFTSEYITPHRDALKSPVPLNMIKVKPGVEYKFMFILQDFCIDGQVVVTAEQKQDLFKELLLVAGIGAKTNVGFGQLSEEKVEFKEFSVGKDATAVNRPKTDQKKITYTVGKIYEGEFKEYLNDIYAQVTLFVGGNASVWDKEHRCKGKKVKLKYKGKNMKGYDLWDIVEIV